MKVINTVKCGLQLVVFIGVYDSSNNKNKF